jgi:hypothetical protein
LYLLSSIGWQVYDGASILSDVISVGLSGEISGDMANLPAADKTITSSAGAMTIQFVSDESLNAGGFEAAYRCGFVCAGYTCTAGSLKALAAASDAADDASCCQPTGGR